jgi:hypothetical protein
MARGARLNLILSNLAISDKLSGRAGPAASDRRWFFESQLGMMPSGVSNAGVAGFPAG